MDAIGIIAGAALSAPGGGLPLDLAPGADAAFGTRLLRAAYAGALVRLRRDSDDAEQDFAPTAGLFPSTDAIAFAGGGGLWVAKWYDQSGNGRDATMADTSRQPLMDLSSPALPKLVWGSGDADTGIFMASDIAVGAVSFWLAPTSDNRTVLIGSDANQALQYGSGSDSNWLIYIESGVAFSSGPTSSVWGNYAFNYTAAAYEYYVSGVFSEAQASPQLSVRDIGRPDVHSASLEGSIDQILIYPSALTAGQLLSIHDATAAYYGG